MWPPEIKQKAIQLRKHGLSQKKIREKIPRLPKGTLSGWLKNIELTREQKRNIMKRTQCARERGRERAGITNHQKRVTRLNQLRNEATKEFFEKKDSALFQTGLILYWAEGAKKQEQFLFMNSDSRLLLLMIRWLNEICRIQNNDVFVRIYMHKTYSQKQIESYWKKTLPINPKNYKKTIFKPTLHRVKKNPNYNGCVRIEISGSDIYHKIRKWFELFAKEYQL